MGKSGQRPSRRQIDPEINNFEEFKPILTYFMKITGLLETTKIKPTEADNNRFLALFENAEDIYTIWEYSNTFIFLNRKLDYIDTYKDFRKFGVITAEDIINIFRFLNGDNIDNSFSNMKISRDLNLLRVMN